MLPRRIPPARPGARRTTPARAANPPLALLEQLGRLRGGRGTLWSPAGPLLAQPGIATRLGYTPQGGIPARDGDGLTGVDVSEVSLAIYPRDGYRATLKTWPSTFVGFNLSSQDVAGSTYTIYALVTGLWVCVWEDCPSSG